LNGSTQQQLMEYCLTTVIFKWSRVKQWLIHCTILKYNGFFQQFSSQFLVTTLEEFIQNVFLMEKKVMDFVDKCWKIVV